MTESDDGHIEELLQRSEENDRQLEDSIIKELLNADKKHVRVIKILVIIVTVLGLALVVEAFSIAQVFQNTRGLAKVESLCIRGNADKAYERELWDAIFAVPPRPDQTPEEKAASAHIKEIILRKTRPQDCSIP